MVTGTSFLVTKLTTRDIFNIIKENKIPFLGIRDISKIPLNVSLGDFGMDSLMAVEIKQTLEREADIVLSTEQIRDLTMGGIQALENKEKDSNTTNEGW